jgi:hypothetical protein
MENPLDYSNVPQLSKKEYHYLILKMEICILITSSWVFQSDSDKMSKKFS